MQIFDSVLGNAGEEPWKSRLADAQTDRLELSQWDAQKSRFRKETAGGRSVAVALERGQTLRDGDILEWNEEDRRALVCRVRLCPVMAADMSGLSRLPMEEALASAVKLGHALGNQHWPVVVMGGMVYVPVTTDSRVMGAVMDTHAINGVNYVFLAGEDVARLLEEQDARRLFGGAGMTEEGGGHHKHAHHEHTHHEADESEMPFGGYFGFYRAAMEASDADSRDGRSKGGGLRGPHGKRQRGRRHRFWEEA